METFFGKFRGKLKAKRKGVTPVIAIVLLLMMTVAAAGMAYVFINQVQNDAIEDATNEYDSMKDATALSLKFETVTDNSGQIHVTVRNNGKRGIGSSELANYVLYVDKVQDSAGTTSLRGCTLDAVASVCDFDLSAAFPTSVGIDDGVLLEIIAPIQDKTFTYNCVLKQSGDSWC